MPSGYGRKGVQVNRDHLAWLRRLPVEEMGPYRACKGDDHLWYIADCRGVCVLDEWLGIGMERHVALFLTEAMNTRVAVSPVMGGSYDLSPPDEPIYRYDWNV